MHNIGIRFLFVIRSFLTAIVLKLSNLENKAIYTLIYQIYNLIDWEVAFTYT